MTDSNFQIPDVSPRVQYLSTGGQVDFPIPFRFFQDGDIEVFSEQSDTPLSPSLYTIVGAGTNSDGTLTFLAGRTSGEMITIARNSSIERVVNFQNSGDWQAQNVNDQLNRLTTYIQEVRLKAIELGVKLPVTSPLSGLFFPPGGPGYENLVIGFGPDGDELVVGPSFQFLIDSSDSAAASALAAANSASAAAADRVQTGQDVITTTNQRVLAENAADDAEQARADAQQFAIDADVFKIEWKGEWAAGSHLKSDAVGRNGSSWVANKDTSDVPSGSSADWDLMAASGIGLTDGDKGDITVSDSGDNWKINDGALSADTAGRAKMADKFVTFAKIVDLAADTLIGAVSAGTAVAIACTSFGRALLAAASVLAQRVALGLGTTNDNGFGIVRQIPPTLQNSAYTFALSDNGGLVFKNGSTAVTYTIPANADVAIPIGAAISLCNYNNAGNITITPDTGVTLHAALATTSAGKTLAPRGIATLYKISTNNWIISGAGVS